LYSEKTPAHELWYILTKPGLNSQSVLSSICLELATFTRHQQRLSDDLQISAENCYFSFLV